MDESPARKAAQDTCERCGAHAAGRCRVMIHRRFLGSWRQFFCDRCLRAMWWQSAIGLSLLIGVAVGLSIATYLLTRP